MDDGADRKTPQAIIERVTLTPCDQRQQDPGWKFARGGIPQIQGWIVTLTSTSGVQGWGHVLTTPIAQPDGARTRRVLEEAAQAVQGRSALHQETLHRQLQEICVDVPCVLSGITSAAMELCARSLQVPLSALLGGATRTHIPATRLIPIKAPELMAAEALRLQAQGYLGLKLKLDGDADTDIARVREVRKAVGPGVLLTVDANQAYDADTAIDVCEALRPHGIALMEQPVPAADREGLRRVTQRGLLRIEADEAIGGSVKTLLELIAMGAAHSYNLKVPYFGGLRHTLVAARACEAAQVQCRLGAIFGPRIASAQAAHLASVLRSLEGGAEIAESEHLLDDPFTGFDARNGQLPVSSTPGSGAMPSF